MILGHIAVALATRRRWDDIPISLLTLATFAPDVVRTALVVNGMTAWEANYYSHAAPWCLVVLIAIAAVTDYACKSTTSTLVVSAVVASHVVLDAISGFKPLWQGGPSGLRLERFQQMEFALEVVMLLIGWRLLRHTTAPAWLKTRGFAYALVIPYAALMTASIGERPYWNRCWADPIRRCDNRSWLTRPWNKGILPQRLRF